MVGSICHLQGQFFVSAQPKKVLIKVIIYHNAASSSNWWYSECKSSFEKWQAPLISCTISSTVWMGCLFLFMALLAIFISTMIQILPSEYWNITQGVTQIVRPSTFSIMSHFLLAQQFFLTISASDCKEFFYLVVLHMEQTGWFGVLTQNLSIFQYI